MLSTRDWKSALFRLLKRRGVRSSDLSGANAAEPMFAKANVMSSDEELEPFHLDDPEIATRLGDSSDVMYRTPPHAHLVFPMLRSP